MDSEKLNRLVNEVSTNYDMFDNFVDTILNENCSDLRNLLTCIKRDVVDTPDAALVTIESYFLELTNMLFFLGEKLEKVGFQASIAKQNYQTCYNNAYIRIQGEKEGGKAPTVAVITAKAELETIEESLLMEAYQKAYSIFKTEISAANTMVSSLSKALSRRMSENNLTDSNLVSRRLLNE